MSTHISSIHKHKSLKSEIEEFGINVRTFAKQYVETYAAKVNLDDPMYSIYSEFIEVPYLNEGCLIYENTEIIIIEVFAKQYIK